MRREEHRCTSSAEPLKADAVGFVYCYSSGLQKAALPRRSDWPLLQLKPLIVLRQEAIHTAFPRTIISGKIFSCLLPVSYSLIDEHRCFRESNDLGAVLFRQGDFHRNLISNEASSAAVELSPGVGWHISDLENAARAIF